LKSGLFESTGTIKLFLYEFVPELLIPRSLSSRGRPLDDAAGFNNKQQREI